MQALTHHARARMQQRGIRPEAVEALLDFGCARHLHSKGRELVFFDKKARARLAKADPGAAREAGRLRRTTRSSDRTALSSPSATANARDGKHFRNIAGEEIPMR